MISYLRGNVIAKDEKSLIIDVGGVGYGVYAPLSFLLEAKEGQIVEVYTYVDMATREETISLYGFAAMEELSFFKQLIKISGVGPRSALAALSVARLQELKKAISAGDSSLLQKVSGIGKKTAERIIVELKDKVGVEDAAGGIGASGDRDVYDALAGLGYSVSDIRGALRKISPEAETIEEKVREVLRVLGGRK